MSIFYFGVVVDGYDLKSTAPMCHVSFGVDEETGNKILVPSDTMSLTKKSHELYEMIDMVNQASNGKDFLSIDSFQENTWIEPFLSLRKDERSKEQGKFCLSFQIYRLDATYIQLMRATKVACTKISGGITFFNPSEGSPLTALQIAMVISEQDKVDHT